MSGFELRPRFKVETALDKLQVKEIIRQRTQSPDDTFQSSITENHIFLCIPEQQRHYWSPFLTLEFNEHENGTLLKGLFAPSPAVWTMFMFFYIGIAFIGMIGLFYGLSQWTLNMQPTALWLVPAALFLEISLYLIARAGQKLAKQQMQSMHSFLEEILKISKETIS